MGIGGDQTQHVLWRLQNGDLEGYEAKLFVVMIGTNNMWSKDAQPAQAAAGVRAVIDLIQSKQPKAKILLMSILPNGPKPNPGREMRMEVNQLIAEFAGGAVEYIDISAKYLEADGSISQEVMHDFLHLAPKGYDIWDLLMACFPAGTVSGAPKIRAMQLIHDLEPQARGPYSGVSGAVDLGGALNTAITIRTMVVLPAVNGDWRVLVQAGAGIVADSDPASEFEETLNKARGMLKAIACLDRPGEAAA